MKEILITSTVFILCVLLIRRVFRGKISSRLQYALWLLVALRLMIPVSAEFDLGSFSGFRLMDLVEKNEGGIGERLEETIRLEEPVQMTVNADSVLFRLFTTDEIRETMEGMTDDGPTSVFMAGTLGFSRLDVLWFFWGTGALIVGGWILITNIVFSHRLRKSRKPYDLPEDIKEFVIKGRELADGKKKASSDLQGEEDSQGRKERSRFWRRKNRLPAVYVADGISSPCLYGFPGREAVYLTADVIDVAERLRHVVVHELVHKKHGDGFWAVLRSALVTVYWFHPLVWAAAVCSKRDCELACDEAVLRGGADRERYALALLGLEERRGRWSPSGSHFSGHALEERIKAIMKRKHISFTALVAVLVVMCVTTTVFASAAPEDREDQHQNAPETGYVYDHLGIVEDNGVSIMSKGGENGEKLYSADDGKTWMTEERYHAEYGSWGDDWQVEWWTYEDYKAWLEEEKAALQSMIGERGYTGTDGWFTWDQKKVDEAIALYESILEDIRNGALHSKTIIDKNGREVEDVALGSDGFVIASTFEEGKGTLTAPKELDEAARLDGCSKLTMFSRIIVPLTKPAIATVTILSFINRWNDYMSPLLYIKRTPNYTVSIALKLYLDSTSSSDYGAMFAMAVVSLVPLFVIFITMNKYLVDGVATSGIKG